MKQEKRFRNWIIQILLPFLGSLQYSVQANSEDILTLAGFADLLTFELSSKSIEDPPVNDQKKISSAFSRHFVQLFHIASSRGFNYAMPTDLRIKDSLQHKW